MIAQEGATGREGAGAILLRGGAIAGVEWGAAPATAEDTRRIDAQGLVLAPGRVGATPTPFLNCHRSPLAPTPVTAGPAESPDEVQPAPVACIVDEFGVRAAVVPEPPTVAMLAAGLCFVAGVACARRRR